MKKQKTRIAAILFFIVSAAVIAGLGTVRHFLPSQQVQLSHGVQYGAVLKGFLFVQEITMEKRYISRIDLYMAKLPRTYPNRNVFLLVDDQRRILFTKQFSSEDFGEALYFPFSFGKQFDIGRGKKIYACIYSLDGDQGSYIGLARKDGSHLGKLYVMNIVNDDIVRSLEEKQGLVDFEGSIGARTFESNTRFFSILHVILYLLAASLACLIFFAKEAVSFVRRSAVIPEYAFLGFSLVFGLAILVITPPFMVPDEPAHFYRAYQVSEWNIHKRKSDVPKSLSELGAICDRMQFSTHEKTTRREILDMGNIRTNPSVRISKETPDYTLPYIPQAFGIAIGKIAGLEPLWLFYLARLCNLLTSVTLLFLAIRITPVFKWGFFLLGIMPMTLYQVSSISYDAVTIGLCFLFLAAVLDHAYGSSEKPVSGRSIGALFLLAILLAAAKQPYVVIIATFLVIPAAKLGSVKRYIAVFTGLVLAAAIVSQLGTYGKALFAELDGIRTPGSNPSGMAFSGEGIIREKANRELTASLLPLIPRTAEAGNAAPEQTEQVAVNPVDPSSQIRFILQHPVKYTGILLNTLGQKHDLYLTSFVGLFGWIDTPLSPVVAYGYLVVLLLFALLDAGRGKTVGLKGKLIFAGVFIAVFVLIETALYIYCNPVGCDPVTAVQGRYFIAIGPLFFLLFINRKIPEAMNKLLHPAPKPLPGKKTPKQEKKVAIAIDFPFEKALPWIAMIMALTTMAISISVILERFYVITL